MFVVFVGAILTTLLWLQASSARARRRPGSSSGSRSGCGSRCCSPTSPRRWPRAAARRRRTRCARRAATLPGQEAAPSPTATPSTSWSRPPTLRKGDVVLVEAGDFIPADGEVVEGVASVDESAITGESAPGHPRERRRPQRGHRRHARALRLARRRITANPGETFLDRMIALVEGAKRQKTPNEIALDILLAALTIIFLLATATLLPFSHLQRRGGRAGHAGHGHRARRPARLPDPDHDRRAARRPSASPAWTA